MALWAGVRQGRALGQWAGPRQLGGQCLSARPPHLAGMADRGLPVPSYPTDSSCSKHDRESCPELLATKVCHPGLGPRHVHPRTEACRAGGGEDDVDQETAGSRASLRETLPGSPTLRDKRGRGQGHLSAISALVFLANPRPSAGLTSPLSGRGWLGHLRRHLQGRPL